MSEPVYSSQQPSQSDAKRKRRSFWEPESETLKAWLDAQNDLGVSLQLIIVDAMQTYGGGDVIKAHLSQREAELADRLAQPAQRVLTTEPVQALPEPELLHAVPEPQPQAKSEPVVHPEPEPEPTELEVEARVEVNEVKTTVKPTQPAPKPQLFTEQKPQPSTTTSAQQASGAEDEEEYDPIAVLMNDIGSRLQE